MVCECGAPMIEAAKEPGVAGTRWECESCPRVKVERWSPRPLLEELRAALANAKVPRV